MEIVYILLPASLFLGGLAFFAFRWALKSGQYDDLDTPQLRVLVEDYEQDEKQSQGKSEP